MTVHNLAEAKEAQKRTIERIRQVFSQTPVASVSLREEGDWVVQLRFPLSITKHERVFLKSLEEETGITLVVEDRVGVMRHLVRSR